jgi:hypothetical protein
MYYNSRVGELLLLFAGGIAICAVAVFLVLGVPYMIFKGIAALLPKR